MRIVSYLRHEFHHPDPEECRAPLLTFLYDVPYLDACGVFPPLHILNQVLESGGEVGGMGPGATWEPFGLSSSEYDALVREIEASDSRGLREDARYGQLEFIIDRSFDHIEELVEWHQAVCAKHRASYQERLSRAEPR